MPSILRVTARNCLIEFLPGNWSLVARDPHALGRLFTKLSASYRGIQEISVSWNSGIKLTVMVLEDETLEGLRHRFIEITMGEVRIAMENAEKCSLP